MKTLALVAFSFVGAGCLGSYVPGTPGTSGDMAEAASGNGGGGGSGGSVGGSGDMAYLSGSGGSGGSGGGGGGSTDMAMAASGGGVAYAAACTATTPPSQSNCATGLLCEQFAGGTEHKCTKPCTKPQTLDPAECPAPSDGTCTPNSYCKLP